MKHSPDKELVPGPELAYIMYDMALTPISCPRVCVPDLHVMSHILRREMPSQIRDGEGAPRYREGALVWKTQDSRTHSSSWWFFSLFRTSLKWFEQGSLEEKEGPSPLRERMFSLQSYFYSKF